MEFSTQSFFTGGLTIDASNGYAEVSPTDIQTFFTSRGLELNEVTVAGGDVYIELEDHHLSAEQREDVNCELIEVEQFVDNCKVVLDLDKFIFIKFPEDYILEEV